jgi:hypothetical protein
MKALDSYNGLLHRPSVAELFNRCLVLEILMQAWSWAREVTKYSLNQTNFFI